MRGMTTEGVTWVPRGCGKTYAARLECPRAVGSRWFRRAYYAEVFRK